MKMLALLLPLSVSAQCYISTDTIQADGCSYVVQVPPLLLGVPRTLCYTLVPESDNVQAEFISLQSTGCGPVAYLGLSYGIYSSDCADTINEGTLQPIWNTSTYLPQWEDTSYVMCYTFIPQCDTTNAVCATHSFSPLPVTLLHFDGYQYERGVMLEWATASESNSSYFRVERGYTRNDMDPLNIIWKYVGSVNASGYSQDERTYSLFDRHPLSGVSYYRLRQIDVDGSEQVFNVIAVTVKSDSPTSQFNHYNVIGQEK